MRLRWLCSGFAVALQGATGGLRSDFLGGSSWPSGGTRQLLLGGFALDLRWLHSGVVITLWCVELGVIVCRVKVVTGLGRNYPLPS